MPLQGPASGFCPLDCSQCLPPTLGDQAPSRRWAAPWGPILPWALPTSPPRGKEELELEGGYQNGDSAALSPDFGCPLLPHFLWVP